MNELLPRRDAVLALLTSRERPLTSREMATRLGVSEGVLPGFGRFLESLAQEGALRLLEGDRYALVVAPATPRGPRPDPDEYDGVLEMLPGLGGLLRAPDRPEDLRIPAHAVGGALHGDRVLARVLRRGALGPEGEVLRVLLRAPHRVAGLLRRSGASARIEPDDPRIRGPIVLRDEPQGRNGDAVVGQITRFPEYPDENPEGTLIACLGPPGSLRVEEQKILIREGIDELPPPDAQLEAQFIGSDPPPRALRGREDLSRLPLIAIDPREDGPLDLAFLVEENNQGFSAWIVAADGAHLVPPGSALDAAARARGCSITLPERLVSMLPAPLAADPAALLPGRLRLCLSLCLRLGPGAEVLEARWSRAFVCVKTRLPLDDAADALEEPPPQQPPTLLAADNLAQALHARRRARGALDLDDPTAQVRLRNGVPFAIERSGDSPGSFRALRILRELSLLAGEVAGEFCAERGLAAPFLVQGELVPTRLEGFLALCERAGLPADDLGDDPHKLAVFLRRVQKHPWAGILQAALRRALPEPVRQVSGGEHFRLASRRLVPWTSPLGRHAELLAQRVIVAALEQEAQGRRLVQGAEEEAQLARDLAQATALERRAVAVEREALALHRAWLLRQRVGETLEGQVTGVTSDGVVVTTSAPFAEVQVRADALGRERYELDGQAPRFHARQGGDSVGLGDRVAVTIEEVVVCRRHVSGWRHTPDMADRAPLRHAPFRPATKKRATGKRSRR